MPVIDISAPGDPRLADYTQLSDAELLRSRGLFIAEGRHVVRRLLTASRFGTRSLLLTDAARAGLGDVLAHVEPRVPIYVVTQQTMNAVAGFNIHRGCLAAGERPAVAQWPDLVSGAGFVVVLERVSNADNVGAAFRNAAAFGAGAVLLGPACADPLYRKAIRTSMGAALRVPFAELPRWPDDLGRLRDAGFRIWALTPSEGARLLKEAIEEVADERARTGTTPRVALLAGHEGEGLTREALAAADLHVRIPIAEGVDSLNVATAVGIAMYEMRFALGTGGSPLG